MATEKRLDLIDRKELVRLYSLWIGQLQAPEDKGDLNGVQTCLAVLKEQPTVDAVPVDEIKFLYCAIDKNGIPELKIQLGDRILCLRRENDPVDVVSVVRCKDCKYWVEEKELGMFCGCCGGMLTSCKQDDFCSYGERKDNAFS